MNDSVTQAQQPGGASGREDERLDQALALLRALPREAAAPDFAERTVARVLSAAATNAAPGWWQRPRWREVVPPGWLLAAAAAAALLLGYVFGAPHERTVDAPALLAGVGAEPSRTAVPAPPPPASAAAVLAANGAAGDPAALPRERVLEVRQQFDALRAELELLAELRALRQPVVAVAGDERFDYVFDFSEVEFAGAQPVGYAGAPP